MNIRRARADEASALTALCLKSKAVWGYDAAFLEASTAALTLTPESIERDLVWVAESGGRPLGVASIVVHGSEAELDLMFVAPEQMRSGTGKALFDHVVKEARVLGAEILSIVSDIHASGFYECCGARYVRDVPSDAIPGRMLPLLTIDLTDR